ncbi:MAG: ParB/RepB/Spo0J family partition protein, partial [Bauldia sp.]
MAEDPGRRRLGRGLAALIGDMGTEPVAERPSATSPRRLPLAFLRANPRNPRKAFDTDDLNDLAASIREKGVVQPILVRPVAGADDSYEIIAGERRWRAAQKAGLHEVPVVVHDVSDKEALELAIIENVQRADLNPLEEAVGYQQLIEEHSYSQAQLAEVIGKSRPHIANTLRLLKLPDSVREYLKTGQLSAG